MNTLSDSPVRSESEQQSSTEEKQNKGLVTWLWEYAKGRFNRQNWFGSAFILNAMYATYEGDIKAGRERITVSGKREPDYTRIIPGYIFMAEKIWSFFSARGAKIPEGNTVLKRVKNAFLHPQQSSAQFEWLILLPMRLYVLYGHLSYGIKAWLGTGERSERARLGMAASMVVLHGLMGWGHFKKHKKPEQVSEAQKNSDEHKQKRTKPLTIKQVFKHIKKYNPEFLLAGSLGIFYVLSGAYEGLKKKNHSRTEAFSLVKQTISGLASECAATYYIASRIAQDAELVEEKPPLWQAKIKNERQSAKPYSLITNLRNTTSAQRII